MACRDGAAGENLLEQVVERLGRILRPQSLPTPLLIHRVLTVLDDSESLDQSKKHNNYLSSPPQDKHVLIPSSARFSTALLCATNKIFSPGRDK